MRISDWSSDVCSSDLNDRADLDVDQVWRWFRRAAIFRDFVVDDHLQGQQKTLSRFFLLVHGCKTDMGSNPHVIEGEGFVDQIELARIVALHVKLHVHATKRQLLKLDR